MHNVTTSSSSLAGEQTAVSQRASECADLILNALRELIHNFDDLPTHVATRVVARLYQVGLVNTAEHLWNRLITIDRQQ